MYNLILNAFERKRLARRDLGVIENLFAKTRAFEYARHRVTFLACESSSFIYSYVSHVSLSLNLQISLDRCNFST